jgi:hypothetical protein
MVAALSVARHGPVRRSAAQEDCRACFEGHPRPRGLGRLRCIDSLTHVVGGGISQRPQLRLAVVRLDDVDALAPTQAVLAADRHRQLHLLGRHRLEPERELCPFGAARCVVVDGFVHRLGDHAHGVHVNS